MHPDRGATVNRCDKSPLDRERANPGEDIAARRRPVHPHGFDIHLCEEIVDVAVGTSRRPHDRDLAGRRTPAAEPVYLPVIRGPHDGGQQDIQVGPDMVEIRLEQVDPFGGATAHQHRGYRDHGALTTSRVGALTATWLPTGCGFGLEKDIDLPSLSLGRTARRQ